MIKEGDKMAGVYPYDLDVALSMTDSDYFIINQGTKLVRLQKNVLLKLLNSLTSEQIEKVETIKVDEDGKLFLDNAGKYRTVTLNDISDLNDGVDDIINAFTVDDDGQLLFNGQSISDKYELPVATSNTLGGVKVDGNTITIDENGIISGASTYELPVASDTVLGGVKVDNDTIKINDGVISADVIGNWSAGISYPVGYFVVYDNALYQCIIANNDDVWTESNWTPIGSNSSETGMTINNWTANTEYAVGNLVINETTIYQCNTAHTSGETFDNANWTAMTGEKGDKGEDGISPHIDETTNHWFVGENDTGINASGTGVQIDDESTTGTDVTWSANKINTELTNINNTIGDINTILAGVTGGIE